MIPRTLAAAFLVTTFVTAAFPQAATLGANCDLSVIGATETKSFLTFDRELREALTNQDAGMTALLVKYPLRVNDDRGTYYLHEAASLGFRFQEVFPSAVRDVVLKQSTETLWCNSEGVMYGGDGTVWVSYSGKRYAIQTVNLPTRSKLPASPVRFVCDADKHRVVVDTDGGLPRYRAWTKPHPLTEKPDLEITKGEESYEGSGACVHARWSFAEGKTEFIVSELGCGGEQPEDATGMLEVDFPGKPSVTWWCH
jgi:hypothetical protein